MSEETHEATTETTIEESTAILSETIDGDALTIVISGISSLPRGTHISLTVVIGGFDPEPEQPKPEPTPEPEAAPARPYMGMRKPKE